MNCPCCGTEYQRDGLLLRCCRCGHGFREYDGDPIEYHAHSYRKDPRFHRHSGEFDDSGSPTTEFHKARKKIVARRLKLARKYIKSSDVCLDIGSGAGTFAHKLQSKVASVDCLELDPTLVAESRRLGHTTFTEDFLKSEFSHQYDVVFAWHVLEHVPDIMSFARKAMQLAKRHLIFEVPVNRRVPEEFDGHYHYFSETSLRLTFGAPRVVEVVEGVQSPALLAIVDAR